MCEQGESLERQQWQAWRKSRHEELSAPDSWLGLAGLFWLEPGRNTVGSAPESSVVLPGGPALLGEIINEGGRLLWQSCTDDLLLLDELPSAVQSGVAGKFLQVDLKSDSAGSPSVIGFGAVRFFVIARDGKLAVRVKNRDWATAMPFAGIDCFPFSPDWIVDAEWQALASPRTMEVPSVTGELKIVEVTHRAWFELAGNRVELLPLSIDEKAVFFVFRDRTSGRVTYGGGRFLQAGPPQGGLIRLDFNRAYNPPCAFSPFATCPLPPPENWLNFPVEAGEKRTAGLH